MEQCAKTIPRHGVVVVQVAQTGRERPVVQRHLVSHPFGLVFDGRTVIEHSVPRYFNDVVVHEGPVGVTHVRRRHPADRRSSVSFSNEVDTVLQQTVPIRVERHLPGRGRCVIE